MADRPHCAGVGAGPASSGTVRFALLGAVRVWRDGVELDPGPPLQRALLAALLVRANEPVRLRDIVDVLWRWEQPPSAINIVQRYVGALRRLFEPDLPARTPGRWLSRVAGGYQFRADEGELDLLRFRALTGRAREAAHVGAGDQAIERFAEALELWHGPVGGGIAQDVQVHRIFTALNREHLAVLAEAADLALAQDRAGRVLAPLQDAAVWHPLDDSLHARLALALAATGRQAEALDVYRKMRVRLAGTLGAEPGPELQTAQLQVLNGRSPLAPADGTPDSGAALAAGDVAPPDESVPMARPAQLPAALAVFAGRQAEIARVLALLPAPGSSPRTLVISAIGGMAGVGKTTLAVHLAHLLASRFPDGQLYVNLRGFDASGAVMPPEEAVRGFLDALGVSPQRIPDDLDAQVALYRSVLAGRRVLVLLDNARDVAQVRPLLPGSPGCLVVVTSRNRLSGLVAADGAHPLALDVLSEEEARESLERRLGADRVAREPGPVDEIIARSARLPLALAVVAARAGAHPTFPLATLAAELRDTAGSLDAFADTDPATDARAVFSWSYRFLSPSAARLFRFLALHPGPDVAVPAVAALAGLPVPATRPLLAELSAAHLVTEQVPGRYDLHDLLRAYAQELVHDLGTEDERRAGTRRMLDHYLRAGYSAATRFDPQPADITPVAAIGGPEPAVTFADAPAALAWFTAERQVLAAVVELAAEAGFETHAWQLAWTLERFHERRGHWHDWARLHGIALGAAQRLPDRAGVAHAHRGLGRAHALLRHYEDAHTHLRAALGLFGEAGDRIGQAYTHYYIGWVLTRQDRQEEALGETRAALELYRAADHQRGQASTLNAVGWLLTVLGEYEDALAHARQALALYGELGDDRAQSLTWDTVGYAYHHLGRYAEAVDSYGNALRPYRITGDRYNEAGTRNRLGDTHAGAGDLASARDSWRAAADALVDVDPTWADEIRTKIAETP